MFDARLYVSLPKFYRFVQNPTPDESYLMLEGRCKIDAKYFPQFLLIGHLNGLDSVRRF